MVGLCAAVVTAQLMAAGSALERERARWGSARRVWVATGAADAGDIVALEERMWPDAVVPDEALTRAPVDVVAARSVARGQLLTAADLVGDGAVPNGWQVFAVPADGQPALAPSQRVSMYSAGTLLCRGTTAAVRPADSGVVEVAVPDQCAAAVSAALADGGLVVARVA